MRRFNLLLSAILALAAAGCGGGGVNPNNGSVAGIVFDLNGNPVRNARVYITEGPDSETVSNSSGAYVLENVPAEDTVVNAEITVDGIRYYGRNVARVFERERTKSVNIAIVRESQLARLRGTVFDRNGLRVAGARVFALSPNHFSSSMAITNGSGDYVMLGLAAGIQYELVASARTFNSDTSFVTLAAGEERTVNFTLDDETNPTLPAPQNLEAVAWTSPSEATRGREAGAIETVKRLFNPRRPSLSAGGRLTSQGNFIEVDLFWDRVNSSALLGYGIYRGLGAGSVLTAIDFLRDPGAELYADSDEELIELATYAYEITALNTSYPDFPNSESARSNRALASTLGDMIAEPVVQSPLTFRWQPSPGASQYVLYLFDEYPSLDVNSIWNSEASRDTGTQRVYDGPPLVQGRTYYWLVLGVANSDASITISRVQSFVKN